MLRISSLYYVVTDKKLIYTRILRFTVLNKLKLPIRYGRLRHDNIKLKKP
jgi:hypothetical protein